MKNLFAKLIGSAALAGLVLSNTGCRHGLTTALVWQIDEYHPARIPRLQLSTSPGTNDVLVQYDECFAKSKVIRPRAYWLLAYAARDTNAVERPKPKFVNPECITNLMPVEMLCETAAAAPKGFSARPAVNPAFFEVWRDGADLGRYQLPVYSSAPPVTWGRVVLTPVAVTTDTAIVATILFYFGAGGGGGGCGR